MGQTEAGRSMCCIPQCLRHFLLVFSLEFAVRIWQLGIDAKVMRGLTVKLKVNQRDFEVNVKVRDWPQQKRKAKPKGNTTARTWTANLFIDLSTLQWNNQQLNRKSTKPNDKDEKRARWPGYGNVISYN